jgi:hypothetical protein
MYTNVHPTFVHNSQAVDINNLTPTTGCITEKEELRRMWKAAVVSILVPTSRLIFLVE